MEHVLKCICSSSQSFSKWAVLAAFGLARYNIMISTANHHGSRRNDDGIFVLFNDDDDDDLIKFQRGANIIIITASIFCFNFIIVSLFACLSSFGYVRVSMCRRMFCLLSIPYFVRRKKFFVIRFRCFCRYSFELELELTEWNGAKSSNNGDDDNTITITNQSLFRLAKLATGATGRIIPFTYLHTQPVTQCTEFIKLTVATVATAATTPTTIRSTEKVFMVNKLRCFSISRF